MRWCLRIIVHRSWTARADSAETADFGQLVFPRDGDPVDAVPRVARALIRGNVSYPLHRRDHHIRASKV